MVTLTSGGAYRIDSCMSSLSLSSVVVCLSALSDDMSSEATGPFKPKLLLWHPWAGGFSVFREIGLFSVVAMAA